MPSFHQRVYAIVRLIPPGRVLAYGDVAAAIGAARAARQVGWALAALGPNGEDPAGNPIHWQRVILSSGHIAFRGDPVRGPLQRALLEQEGVVFQGDRVPMDRYRWDAAAADLLGDLPPR